MTSLATLSLRNRTGTAPDDQPFLKWAGGKRWLARSIAALLRGPGRYFEPFLGSGAVYFSLRPARAFLSDANPDLVAAFEAVKTSPDAVIDALEALDISRETFARMRSESPTTPLERGVRAIYLNRTAFNGLWRVNKDGRFNVPFGCKPETTPCDAGRVMRCSRDLTGARLQTGDFRVGLRGARADDMVYLDPPYVTRHNDNGFRRYNERLFSWPDQLALAKTAQQLASRGCYVVVTNAAHADVAELYEAAGFSLCGVSRRSRMAAELSSRTPTTELVIVSSSVARTDAELRARLAALGLVAAHRWLQ